MRPPERRETGEESVGSFIARRLGRQIEQTFVSPFISGIYAGDSNKLSINATFPTLAEFEELGGSIVIGGIKSMRQRKSQSPQKKRPRRRPTLVSFKKGIESFPAAVAEQLSNILTNCSDIRIDQTKDRLLKSYSVQYQDQESEQTIDCDAVVVATPAFAAADIVRSLSDKAAEALTAIPYPPVIVVAAAFPKDQISRSLDGFGFLIPRSEGLRMLGCVWSSSLFPGRAPEDRRQAAPPANRARGFRQAARGRVGHGDRRPRPLRQDGHRRRRLGQEPLEPHGRPGHALVRELHPD